MNRDARLESGETFCPDPPGFRYFLFFAFQVKELKDALEERGLDSKGVKAVLKERLAEALALEKSGGQVAAVAVAADAEAAEIEETAEDSVPSGIENSHVNGDMHTVSFWDYVHF